MALTLLDTLKDIAASLASLDSENTATTATSVDVPAATLSASLLAANTSRKGYKLYNDSTADAYVTLGVTSTLTVYSFKMPKGSLYESEGAAYTGPISCVWNSANGAMKVTELT